MSRTDVRNALICGAALIVAFLLVNPFARMPFDDDWSYAFSVREFIRTGHLIYNGWSAPLIISHIFWGALFTKIFGYSFVVLRFSTLPLAAGCGILAYLLARRADIPPAGAFFFFLLLCLSPLFLPLALSFMTDVPALFCTLFCLYAFVRAAQLRHALPWLAAGIVCGIVGGMDRQTVWVVPLSIIPYLIWLRRRDRLFVAAAVAGFLLVIADIYLSLRWFDRQPWVYLDPPLITCIRMGFAKPGIFLNNLVMVCLTIVLLVLPAVLPFVWASLRRLWRERKSWRGGVTAFVFCVLGIAVVRNPNFELPPWLFNILSVNGVIGGLELSGHRPVALPLPVRCFFSAIILLGSYLLVSRIVEFILEPRPSLAKLREFLCQGTHCLPILAIFGMVYFLLMIIRSAQDLVFDRYCLPLIPCLAIPLIRNFRPRTAAWALLIVYAIYALASTQDNLALAAARRAAIDRLEAAGVPSTEIAAGFEYDFYTQLEQAGHINRYGIRNPPNSFDPSVGNTPALICRYRLEWAPYADTSESRFGTIDFISWLPPFHRRIFIDEFRHPWWLKPDHPGRTPLPFSYEAFYD
jgi:hypothetical protein